MIADTESEIPSASASEASPPDKHQIHSEEDPQTATVRVASSRLLGVAVLRSRIQGPAPHPRNRSPDSPYPSAEAEACERFPSAFAEAIRPRNNPRLPHGTEPPAQPAYGRAEARRERSEGADCEPARSECSKDRSRDQHHLSPAATRAEGKEPPHPRARASRPLWSAHRLLGRLLQEPHQRGGMISSSFLYFGLQHGPTRERTSRRGGQPSRSRRAQRNCPWYQRARRATPSCGEICGLQRKTSWARDVSEM